jgi:hypothetical protein
VSRLQQELLRTLGGVAPVSVLFSGRAQLTRLRAGLSAKLSAARIPSDAEVRSTGRIVIGLTI